MLVEIAQSTKAILDPNEATLMDINNVDSSSDSGTENIRRTRSCGTNTAVGAVGGALPGAAAGAGLGSAVPVVGTFIGGIIGAVIGATFSGGLIGATC